MDIRCWRPMVDSCKTSFPNWRYRSCCCVLESGFVQAWIEFVAMTAALLLGTLADTEEAAIHYPSTLSATIQVIRYIRILDILWYCDPGWDHKPKWIKIYGRIFQTKMPWNLWKPHVWLRCHSLFFPDKCPHIFGSPTRLTTLLQALLFFQKNAPLNVGVSHGISNQ